MRRVAKNNIEGHRNENQPVAMARRQYPMTRGCQPPVCDPSLPSLYKHAAIKLGYTLSEIVAHAFCFFSYISSAVQNSSAVTFTGYDPAISAGIHYQYNLILCQQKAERLCSCGREEGKLSTRPEEKRNNVAKMKKKAGERLKSRKLVEEEKQRKERTCGRWRRKRQAKISGEYGGEMKMKNSIIERKKALEEKINVA